MAEIIFGIDHGNGNMKGETSSFPCGIVRYTAQPGRFMNEDILVKGNLPQASSSPPGICLFFWRLWNELKSSICGGVPDGQTGQPVCCC